ncbi:MAG: hypothetical protein WC967_13535 [Balneolaceae bacterium]
MCRRTIQYKEGYIHIATEKDKEIITWQVNDKAVGTARSVHAAKLAITKWLKLVG